MHLADLCNTALTLLSLSHLILTKRIIECEKCGLEDSLRSAAIGVDINAEYLTLAIKGADGTLSTLAKVSASDELQGLMYHWANEPIETFPEEDTTKPDDQHLSTAPAITDADQIITRSILKLLTSISTQFPDLEPRHLPHALSLPPFVHRRHFSHFHRAVARAWLAPEPTSLIDHSDKRAHMSYNALYCLYHSHPHSGLCASGSLSRGVFDALVIDYGASLLTITWLETVSPLVFRRSGFTDNGLGGKEVRERNYWVTMGDRIAKILHAIDDERGRHDLNPPPPDEVGRNQLIFVGPLGQDELLRAFLRDALAGTRFDFDKSVVQASLDPAFAGALSTAAIQKAVIDAPQPRNCDEPVKCQDLRERVYREVGEEAALKLEL